MGSFELLLAALAAPPQRSDVGIMTSPLPLSTAGAGGLAAIKTMQMSSSMNLRLDTPVYQFPVSPTMRMGDVTGIRGLTLNVGSGPSNSSVLISKGHDVSLEKHTLMLLVPAQGTFPRATTSAGAAHPGLTDASGATSTAAETRAGIPLAPPVNDIDLCAPPECSEALPAGDAVEDRKAAASISILELGYSPRPQKEMKGFDNDEALMYLGPKELLVTFNPHGLAPRHMFGRAGPTIRVIRAAVVDTDTHKVIHSTDWDLPDNGEFLWPLDQNRVLVHVGSELRVYGEGLKVLNRVSLEGPLSFVRVTPDGSFVAVGVTRERHTTQLHTELKQNLNGEPEEDVEVLVLNRNFEPIAKSTARSGVMAPTLLNEGQAKLLALPNKRYRVSMLTWDNQASTLARFNSSCTPELTSFSPDLIFLVSCDRNEARQYRVLDSSGKLALKSGASSNDLGHSAKGSANQKAFVVKTVQASMSLVPGDPFSASDFASEELGVYRATDGKHLLGVRVNLPSSSRDGYALAPDSSQLAVLTRDQIAIYSVPGN